MNLNKKKQSSILTYFKPKVSLPANSEENKLPLAAQLIRNSATLSQPKKSVLPKKRSKSIKKATPIGLPLQIICLSSGSDSESDDDDEEIQVIQASSASCSSNPTLTDDVLQQKNQTISCQIPDENSLDEMKENYPMDMADFLTVCLEEKPPLPLQNWLDSDALVTTQQERFAANDYKLMNFRSIIDFTLKDSGNHHLFNDDDWQIIERLTSLSVPSQRLFIRLYLRKHRWIRSSRINYPDVADDIDPFLDELVKNNLLIPCDVISDLREALSLLDLAELKSCIRIMKPSMKGSNIAIGGGNSNQNKSALLDCILKHSKSQSIKAHFTGKEKTIEEVVLNQVKKVLGNTGYCVDPKACGLFSRMTYLYYPPQVNEDENGVSISHEFFNQLKVTNGDMVYPQYQMMKKEVIYRTRDDLVDYEAACRLETQILSAIEKKDHAFSEEALLYAMNGFNLIFTRGTYQADAKIPRYLRNMTSGHVYTRCLNHLIGFLEQTKKYSEAVSLLNQLIDQDTYCQSYKGKWYERLAIDTERHLKDPKTSFDLLKKALKDPEVKLYHRNQLLARAKKLAKSIKTRLAENFFSELEETEKLKEEVIEADTLHKPIQGRRTIFTSDGGTSVLPVEDVALNYYKTNKGFSHGYHSESMIYHGLFNILFWNEIYMPLEDAFRTFHQTLPLDFVTEDFYLRRQPSIDQRVAELKKMSDSQVRREIDLVWNENFGTSCLVAWDHLTSQTLKEVAICMGMDTLTAICLRMCSNFRHNRSGFPDLLLWDPATKRVKAVEVKGPSDSLSAKQILWLSFFALCGLDAEVCYVKARTK